MAVIDPFSDACFPVWAMFGLQEIGHATASLWQHEGRIFLVTNWHVVAGRNPNTLSCTHKMGAIPDSLKLEIDDQEGKSVNYHFPLYDNDQPIWYIHPDFGKSIDIAALEVTGLIPKNTACINMLPQSVMDTHIGTQLFVLGFPFDPRMSLSGHFPIWKAATVASEPDFSPDISRFMLVDTASRKGMSGAPVIQRARAMFAEMADRLGGSMLPASSSYPVTKIVGIYSGRLHTQSEMDVQLGIVWPTSLVAEMISNGRRDYLA
jgi:hypothetical protein